MTTENSMEVYGESAEVQSLAKRIKYMMPGGQRYTDQEAVTLAQVSYALGANPFIGEVWYIPGSGPMVGIKSLRRFAKMQVEREGEKSSYYWIDFQICSLEEAGYKGPTKDVRGIAFRAILRDTVSTDKYLAGIKDIMASLDPGEDRYTIARDLMGPKPEWIGYGYCLDSEKTRMNKNRVARKRAESEAIQLRFSVPFGGQITVNADDDPDVIQAEVQVESTEDEIVDVLMGEAPKSKVAPDSTKSNGKAVLDDGSKTGFFPFDQERPWDPNHIMQVISWEANNQAKRENVSANHRQRGLADKMAKSLFGDKKDEAIELITGYETLIKKNEDDIVAPGVYIHALLWWMDVSKQSTGEGSEWVPGPWATKEAWAIKDLLNYPKTEDQDE